MTNNSTDICLACQFRQLCEEHYGRIGIDKEDCRAIYGTHFCRADWQKFIDDSKKRHTPNCTPLDNDSDIDDFDVEKIERMEVELMRCDSCRGSGIAFNGQFYCNCPACAGTGEVPKKEMQNENNKIL